MKAWCTGWVLAFDADERRKMRGSLADRFGLGVKLFSGGRCFLGGGGDAFGGLVHFEQRVVDVGQSHMLLLGGGGNVGDNGVDITDFGENLAKMFTDAGEDLHAEGAALGCVLNLIGGFAGGQGAALGKRADLIGHYGEAGAGFASTSGFHRGIEGKDVGLKGDFIDGFDDFADLAGGLLDGVHGLLHVGHFGGAVFGGVAGLGSRVFPPVGMLGIAVGHGGERLEVGGDLLKGAGLFSGTRGECEAGIGYLAGGGARLFDCRIKTGHQCAHRADQLESKDGDQGGQNHQCRGDRADNHRDEGGAQGRIFGGVTEGDFKTSDFVLAVHHDFRLGQEVRWRGETGNLFAGAIVLPDKVAHRSFVRFG